MSLRTRSAPFTFYGRKKDGNKECLDIVRPRGMSMIRRLPIVLAILVTLITTTLAYTLLHEGGHALMAMAFGAKVTAFEINFFRAAPHMSYSGDLTSWQRGLVSLAGPIFPWLITLAIIPWIKRIKDVFLSLGVAGYSVACLGSLLPNAVLPIVYAISGQGMGEDVIGFINGLRVNPFLASALFVLLIAFTIRYFLRIGQIGPVFLRHRLKTIVEQNSFDINKPTIIGLACLILLFAFYPQKPTENFVDKYRNYAQIDLCEISEAPTTVWEFELTEETVIDLGYRFSNNDELLLQIVSLGESPLLFHAASASTIFDGTGPVPHGIFCGFPLEAGRYGLQVTTTADKGFLEIGLNLNEPSRSDLEFVEMLRSIKEGNFSENSYDETGYELVFHERFNGKTDQIVYSVAPNVRSMEISAFVVSSSAEFSLTYSDGQSNDAILAGFIATEKRGINPGGGGEFKFSLEQGNAELFLYVKTP